MQMSNVRFVEIRPVPEGEITEDEKKQALELSFKLMFDASNKSKKVNNLYCTRALLSSLRNNSSEKSQRQDEIQFFEQLKSALDKEVFHPQILFESVFEFSVGTQERTLLQQSLFQSLSTFGDQATAESIKKEFEIADVVFVAPEYRGIAMAGGIATMLTDLCECFQSMGVNVSVIIPYYRFNK